MKRSPLARKSPLRTRATLRRRPKPPLPAEDRAARALWKEPHAGFCTCGCGRFSMHLERHHCTYEQHVRAEGGQVWNLANSMLLHPLCHARHHSGQRRIRIEYVPVDALSFAVDLFGELRAAEHLHRYYDCTVTSS